MGEEPKLCRERFLKLLKDASNDKELFLYEWTVTGTSDADRGDAINCVCGKKGIIELNEITNNKNGRIIYPVGSSCILNVTEGVDCDLIRTYYNFQKKRCDLCNIDVKRKYIVKHFKTNKHIKNFNRIQDEIKLQERRQQIKGEYEARSIIKKYTNELKEEFEERTHKIL